MFRITSLTRTALQPGRVSSFHTSTPAAESYRKRLARVAKSRNTDRSLVRDEQLERTRPHPVLGVAPGDEAKWESCDLARVLVKPEELEPLPLIDDTAPPDTPLTLPRQHNFGIGEEEKRMLFLELPHLTAIRRFKRTSSQDLKAISPEDSNMEQSRSRMSAAQLARITSLSNASAKGVAFENRRRCIAEFSEPGAPNDTGRSEVQAALATMKIRNMWNHLVATPHDIHNRRTLRILVHQRAKILKYLKGIDRGRYARVLERLAIDPRAVEGEIIIDFKKK